MCFFLHIDYCIYYTINCGFCRLFGRALIKFVHFDLYNICLLILKKGVDKIKSL